MTRIEDFPIVPGVGDSIEKEKKDERLNGGKIVICKIPFRDFKVGDVVKTKSDTKKNEFEIKLFDLEKGKLKEGKHKWVPIKGEEELKEYCESFVLEQESEDEKIKKQYLEVESFEELKVALGENRDSFEIEEDDFDQLVANIDKLVEDKGKGGDFECFPEFIRKTVEDLAGELRKKIAGEIKPEEPEEPEEPTKPEVTGEGTPATGETGQEEVTANMVGLRAEKAVNLVEEYNNFKSLDPNSPEANKSKNDIAKLYKKAGIDEADLSGTVKVEEIDGDANILKEIKARREEWGFEPEEPTKPEEPEEPKEPIMPIKPIMPTIPETPKEEKTPEEQVMENVPNAEAIRGSFIREKIEKMSDEELDEEIEKVKKCLNGSEFDYARERQKAIDENKVFEEESVSEEDKRIRKENINKFTEYTNYLKELESVKITRKELAEPETERREVPENLRQAIEKIEKTRNTLITEIEKRNGEIIAKRIRGEKISEKETAEIEDLRLLLAVTVSDLQVSEAAGAGYSEPGKGLKKIEAAKETQKIALKEFRRVLDASLGGSESSFERGFRSKKQEVQVAAGSLSKAFLGNIVAAVKRLFSKSGEKKESDTSRVSRKEEREILKTIKKTKNVEDLKEVAKESKRIAKEKENQDFFGGFIKCLDCFTDEDKFKELTTGLGELKKNLEGRKDTDKKTLILLGSFIIRFECFRRNKVIEKIDGLFENKKDELEKELENAGKQGGFKLLVGSLKKLRGKMSDEEMKLLTGLIDFEEDGELNYLDYCSNVFENPEIKKEDDGTIRKYIAEGKDMVDKDLEESSAFKSFMKQLFKEIDDLRRTKFEKKDIS